jgi:sRNA-binding carbon storage regulator CsrA
MSKEKGTLTLTCNQSRQMIVSIGDDIKLLVTKENAKIKIVIEAPLDVRVKKLTDLEKALAEIGVNCGKI